MHLLNFLLKVLLDINILEGLFFLFSLTPDELLPCEQLKYDGSERPNIDLGIVFDLFLNFWSLILDCSAMYLVEFKFGKRPFAECPVDHLYLDVVL